MRGQKRVPKGVHARLRPAMDARERAYDPRIPLLCKKLCTKKMDCRVKPGNDGKDGAGLDAVRACALPPAIICRGRRRDHALPGAMDVGHLRFEAVEEAPRQRAQGTP